ncbi:hypothetical protein TNCV_2597241 [Trichonephila clavipes]|nr:hypothetical protein TNCV_2597241 [Trichonephila clavipes]
MAIRNNISDLHKMKTTVWAVYFPLLFSNEGRRHGLLPVGINSSDDLGQYYCRTILDRVLGARAAGVHYRLFSVWTLVPVRLDQQLSDHSTEDEIASGAVDCRLTLHNGELSSKAVKRRQWAGGGSAVGALCRTPAGL